MAANLVLNTARFASYVKYLKLNRDLVFRSFNPMLLGTNLLQLQKKKKTWQKKQVINHYSTCKSISIARCMAD